MPHLTEHGRVLATVVRPGQTYAEVLRRAWDGRITAEPLIAVITVLGLESLPIGKVASNVGTALLEIGVLQTSDQLRAVIIERSSSAIADVLKDPSVIVTIWHLDPDKAAQ